MTFPIRRPLAVTLTLCAALTLAACGSGPTRGRMGAPKPLVPENYPATGIPAQFGDTDPVVWSKSPVRPDAHPIHGIDASRYQGEIDFVAAQQGGINFAWLKATEGGDHEDPGFAINAPRARAAGVPVGAYHFYYFCRTPAEQARWFIQNVPKATGDLPPMLDMEWNHASRTCNRRPDPETVRDEIRQFSSIVANHYGTQPVIYVTPDFYEENDLDSLVGYEFWLRSVAAHPSERYPDERWTFWQYTGTGVAPGVKGNVDLNAFAGTLESWVGWLTARRQP